MMKNVQNFWKLNKAGVAVSAAPAIAAHQVTDPGEFEHQLHAS